MQQLPVRWIAVVACVVGLGVVAGCGLFGTGGNAVTERPAELVLWGDPDPEQGGEGTTIRDVNDLEDRFVVVGTDGSVQFSDGSVCNDCDVRGAIVSTDGTPRMHIRFGPGPSGGDVRRPYLVSTDGFYIELVGVGDSVSFQEESLVFEENNDPNDDLALRVGTSPNPAATQTRNAPLCGQASVLFMPLTALGLAFMRRGRGR